MDRVMISYNVPNFVTVNLMAWFGLLLFFIAFQFLAKRKGGAGGIMSPGADEIDNGGGY